EYALEVGSPGVDRPLTLPRHWRRNVGRLVAVPLRAAPDGGSQPAGQVTGRVLAADDEGIVLDLPGGAREIGYEQLGPGRVQIEFTRWGQVEDGDPEEPDGNDPADLDDEDLEEER
ncbi:MAG TPA: ribosome maturation factor RimP, partial [Micromonosporaceae bacterium]|nr:ribosome maturation factor RimP [Micromonosporaceae bacterium]